jgi:hypothetical protein
MTKHKRKRVTTSTTSASASTTCASASTTTASSIFSTKTIKRAPPQADAYAPEAIYQNISYEREGAGDLSLATSKAFQAVKASYAIPDDFEANWHKFGPRSGVSFEARVVGCYSCGMLESKTGAPVLICTHCGNVGHQKITCEE